MSKSESPEPQAVDGQGGHGRDASREHATLATGPRWRRRGALRAAAAGAMALAGGWALAGCSSGATSAAQPTPTKPKVVLVWQPWRVGWGKGWEGVFYAATESFRTANPGVDIQVDTGGNNSSNDGAVIPQIIAGTGPDIYSGYGPTKMIEGGYNLNLAPYLKQLNVDTSVFDQGEYVKFVRNGGVWALPAELSTSAVAINEGMLDDLGLEYPDQQWDYKAAATLWRAAASKSPTPSKNRVGFVYWGQKAKWLPGDFFLRGWGASTAAANFSAKSGLDTPAALAFAQWWFPLTQAGVIAWNGAAPPWPQQVACGFAGSWTLPNFARLGSSVKWDFWPQPVWPTGTSAYAGNDYYAVSSTTKQPALAAAFAIWLTTDVQWQRSLMGLQLVLPPSRKLWSEWVQVVQTVAPPLKKKNVAAFTVAPLADRAFNHYAFAYDSDRAYAQASNFLPQIASGKMDIVGGMQQAAAAIDQFEAGQAALASGAEKSTLFPTQGPPIATVTPGL